MKKNIFRVICRKYIKLENPKLSHIFEKISHIFGRISFSKALSIICTKSKNEEKKMHLKKNNQKL